MTEDDCTFSSDQFAGYLMHDGHLNSSGYNKIS